MIGQTITVVNKSGKVVSTSKQLINVFKEAKSAYRERKAEIKAIRNAELDEGKIRHALKHTHLYDDIPRPSRPKHTQPQRSRSQRHSQHHHQPAPLLERGISDSFYANDPPSPPNVLHAPTQSFGRNEDFERRELTRRHTDGVGLAMQQRRRYSTASDDNIDMDLAYGELPPPLPPRRTDEEAELRSRFISLQQLLDEANCVQHSVTAMVDRLQKDPEALAAVGLALAEISNFATKMAPGALSAMKGAFPAIMALLASPQFLIAAGVGVGVTIVCLGGYKIIKRIQQRKVGEREDEDNSPEELQELDVDMSQIELWRRGIADVEASSVGTTVDGEYITPGASRRLLEEGLIKEDDIKSTRSGRSRKSSRSVKSKAGSKSGEKSKKKKKKKKDVSGLKLLFKSHH